MIDDVPIELFQAFNAFRRAATPDDVAPQTIVDSVSLAEPSWGLNPALSRMVRTEDPARRFFLVPGDGLLPDGVDRVTITRRNGQTIEVSVPDHVYAVIVDARSADMLPANVQYVTSDGLRVNPVPGIDDELLTSR